jgi:hypothetical protein
MARSSAKIEIRIWTQGDEAKLPENEQDVAELMASHVEHVAGLCRQGCYSGDIFEEGKFSGWWEVKR